MIRLTIPSIEADDLEAVQKILETGYLVQGEQVAAFEETIARYVGVKHAIAVSNCTSALHLSLLAQDVQPGDQVIVTAYSWPATANVIELCGAKPVFVDIHPETFNIDPKSLEDTLHRIFADSDSAHRVKAILPVHTFGQLADMPALLEIAHKYKLPIVEDAACALGASRNGQKAGRWGTLACFSFHPRKAITTGEGGVVVTDSDALARTIRALRNHGQDPDAKYSDFILPGFNYRMTEIQAALGKSQMQKLDRIISNRRRLAEKYNEMLAGSPVRSPVVDPANEHIYQSYVVLLPPGMSEARNRLITELRTQGIETTIGTWHIPLTSYYRKRYNHREGQFPVTDGVFEHSVTLPLHERLAASEQEFVVSKLMEAIGKTHDATG